MKMRIIEDSNQPRPPMIFGSLSVSDGFCFPHYSDIIYIKVGNMTIDGLIVGDFAYSLSDSKLIRVNYHDEVIKLEDCEFHFKRP